MNLTEGWITPKEIWILIYPDIIIGKKKSLIELEFSHQNELELEFVTLRENEDYLVSYINNYYLKDSGLILKHLFYKKKHNYCFCLPKKNYLYYEIA